MLKPSSAAVTTASAPLVHRQLRPCGIQGRKEHSWRRGTKRRMEALKAVSQAPSRVESDDVGRNFVPHHRPQKFQCFLPGTYSDLVHRVSVCVGLLTCMQGSNPTGCCQGTGVREQITRYGAPSSVLTGCTTPYRLRISAIHNV